MDSEEYSDGHISERELEVLLKLANGKASRLIAQELGISIDGVNFHRKKLLEKLDSDNVAQLIYLATKKGLI